MQRLIIFLLIVSAIVSCKKDDNEPLVLWKCGTTSTLDSATITTKLTGSWLWRRQACHPGNNLKVADKYIKAIFKINGTFEVFHDFTIIASGTWRVKPLPGTTYWELHLSQQSTYLPGRILFCENEVMFANSFRDFCDNVFEKI